MIRLPSKILSRE